MPQPTNLVLPLKMRLNYALQMGMAALEEKKMGIYYTWETNGPGRIPPDLSEYDDAIEVIKNMILDSEIIE